MGALFSAAALGPYPSLRIHAGEWRGQFEAFGLRFSYQNPPIGQALGRELRGGSVGALNPLTGGLWPEYP